MLTRSFHRPRTSRRVTCSISIDDARCVATSYVIDTAYFFYDDQVLSLQFSSGDFLIIGSFVSFLHFSSSSVSSCEGRSKVGRTHARALTHTLTCDSKLQTAEMANDSRGTEDYSSYSRRSTLRRLPRRSHEFGKRNSDTDRRIKGKLKAVLDQSIERKTSKRRSRFEIVTVTVMATEIGREKVAADDDF